jgi:RHS repeat-associated protein
MLLTLVANAQNGITIKKSLEGSKGQLVANASIMVQDSTYFDAALQSKLEPSYPVKNAVTLKIDEYSTVYASGPFTATANVRIIYMRPDKVLDSVEKTLAINYDTTTTYKSRNSFVFNDAHRVTLKLLSITCSKPSLIGMLMLENEMNVKPVFKLDPVTDAVKSITMNATANTDSTDEIVVRWGAVTGADEYDLEWAFIDSTALAAGRYGSPVSNNLVFRNNASRVSVRQNEYAVPLMYDNGGVLYVRVRVAQVKNKFNRTETNWFSDFTNGKGAFNFKGHQRKLNWQSNISFAEDGKRKVVVQYFDGSLLNRQTVTKDNSTQTAMVAETMYDQQGRPAIQVLPAPTLSKIIKYTKNFNTAVNGAEYDKAQYDSLSAPNQYLNTSANQMGTGSGAANYYSAQNANINKDSIEKFVPDAEKYPFTETVYTPDNTGRISRQGGVGATYKINGRRETLYSYGTAFQNDLDAMFGTDAGDESHYFKNMVRDANGQYSVTYLDMHGRTIATALAGSADSGRLKDLSTNVIVPVIDTLSGINKTTYGELELISHKSLSVAMKEIYTFTYSLIPPVLKKKDCNGVDVCYIGKFDLTIKISDDSYNQLLGGNPVIKTFTNYNAGTVVSDCAAPAPITLTFSVELQKGNYEVVKTLEISEEALNAYRNTVFLPGSVCTSLEKIIQQQRTLRKDTTCVPTCQSCLTGLGTYTTFATRYMQQMGLPTTDSVAYRAEISTAYTNAAEACNLLCQKISESETVRKAMLADMTAPSGQYANPDSTAYNYSIFSDKGGMVTPRFQDTTIAYLDAEGKPAMVFNENTQQMIRPQNLLPAQFAAKFQPSWANALLRFHPEYCKLLEFEKHKQSQLWDDSFRLINTYADAKAKGYLNPTNGSGNEFTAFGTNPLNADPLVLENGGTYRAGFEALLTNYEDKHYSIWAISAVRLFCAPGDTSCVNNFANPANIFKEGTMCSGDLNMIWRTFRENYLQEKNRFIQQLIDNTACPAGAAKVSARDLSDAGMVPNFNTAANVFEKNGLGYVNDQGGNNPNVSAFQNAANNAMAQSYIDNCNAYVSTWMQQLSACPYSTADWTAIKTQLLAVCKAGSDVEHPFGASSIPDGVNLENRSFEEVIRKYNISKGININGCNGLLLTIPAPYYKQTAVSNKPVFTKPKDCECEKISALKTEYDAAHYVQETFSGYLSRTRKLKIPQATLDDLLNACNASGGCTYIDKPVAIPPVFQCYTPAPCTNCRVVDTLYTKFKNTYGLTPIIPVADTLQQRINELFTAYMNNQLGYGLSVVDYLTFRDSCQRAVIGDTVVSVNKPSIFSFVGGVNGSKIADMKPTKDGGFIMAGFTYTSNKSQDKALLIKASSTGAISWAKTYDVGPQQDYFLKVNETNDGSLIVGGISKNQVTLPGEISPVPAFGTLVKLDAQGNVIWKRGIYSGSRTGDDIRDVLELRNGDIAFTGDYDAYDYTCDITAGVLSSTGNLKWLRKMGTSSSDISQGIIQSNDTLLIAGLTYSSYFNANIIKLGSAAGNFIERRSYDQSLKTDIWGLYNLPGSGARMVTTANTDNGSTNGQGVIIDVNSNGSVRRAIRFSKPMNLDSYFFASGKMSDGSMLFAPSLNETNDGIYVMKMNTDYTLAWQRRLLRRSPDSQVRGIWSAAGNTIMAGGNLGVNPALFTFGSNGMAPCNDSILPMTATDIAINVTTPTLDSNMLITTTAFDFTLAVVNLPLTPANESCGAGSGSMALYKGPVLCGQSKPTFEEVPLELVDNCADSSFYLVNTATEIYKAVTDSMRDNFNTAYINSCMQAASRELFTMSHGLAEYHYTLYYYDQAGNLVKTIPPAGAVVDRSITWLNSVKLARKTSVSKTPLHKLPTKYRYNTLNQVVEQISPDGGVSRFWYDRLGRLAVSQNAKQQIDKYYSYTLYDYLGRITEVGQLKSDAFITNTISRSEAKLKQWLDAVKTSRSQITQTVYDEAYSPVAPYFVASNLRNRVSWSAVYNSYPDIGNLEHAAATYYSYDIHGNVDTLLQDYRNGTMSLNNNRFKKLAYDYDLVSGKVNKVSYQPGMPDAFYHRYIYDAENRITNVETSTDDFYWEKEAFYQYYKHGPLAKAIIGQQQVQGLDYAYTLQGWLKGVNGSSLTPAFDMGNDGNKGSLVARDAFGYALHYYGDNDYRTIGTNANKFAAGAGKDTSIFKPLFNGNIAAMSVNMPAIGEPLVYTYRYDVLNRLSSMTAAKGLNASTNAWTPSKLDDFGEAISYDGNGNILSYIRNGNKTFAGKPLAMDSLTYSYKPGTNQLDYIDDKVTAAAYSNDIDKQTAGNYTYDAIGNLIADKGSNIDSIYWSVYSKIQRLKKKDGTVITYTYDVAGNRVSKRVKNVETWYVRDATGNVMGVYTSGDANVNNGDLSLIESDLYGSSRLGILNRQVNVQHIVEPEKTPMTGVGNGINTIFSRGNKVFELTNHLGNVLATVSDRKRPVTVDGSTVDHYDPILSTAQEYYPFGSLLVGRGGMATAGGWVAGNDNINGYTVPANLTVNSRSDNKPSEYVASQEILFADGFEAGVGDSFTAYIADSSYAGGGGSGNGGSGANGAMGYRYGFNGKENDNEVKGEGNQQDYGLRVYDPRIGKFLSVDPLAPKYPMLTPYQFASNSPLKNIDIDGGEGLDYWIHLAYLAWKYGDLTGIKTLREGTVDKIAIESKQAAHHNVDVSARDQKRIDKVQRQEAENKITEGSANLVSFYVETSMTIESLLAPGEGAAYEGFLILAERKAAPRVSFSMQRFSSSMGSEYIDDGARMVEQLLKKPIDYIYAANSKRADHAMRHLIEEGVLPGTANSKIARNAWPGLVEDVMSAPTKTFDYFLQGTNTTGYYKEIGGKDVVIFVANEGQGSVKAGQVIGGWVPSQAKNPDIMAIIKP